MDEHVLVARGLTKTYGGHAALDDVSVTLDRGRIYGLIGPNGAGKTTLMRMISGLVTPTRGTISLFGSKPAPSPQPAQTARLGSLIEEPGLHTGLTARQNLRLHRMKRGVPDADRETELLELVGLAGAEGKRVGAFSLGMRQRLGIAVALVADPELLVLDEPINGLDPQGVVDVRTLLHRLAEEQGITVLVSSHNLPELYQVATDYVVIAKGRTRAVLTHEELEERSARFLELAAPDSAALMAALEEIAPDAELLAMPDDTIRLRQDGPAQEHSAQSDPDSADPDSAAPETTDPAQTDPTVVLKGLVARDIWPTLLAERGQTLEEFYLTLIQEEPS